MCCFDPANSYSKFLIDSHNTLISRTILLHHPTRTTKQPLTHNKCLFFSRQTISTGSGRVTPRVLWELSFVKHMWRHVVPHEIKVYNRRVRVEICYGGNSSDMMESKLTGLFEKFLKKDSLFADKTVLQNTYMPDEIKHRDEQMALVAHILAPALRNEKPSNLFIYGKTGSGKTLTIQYVAQRLQEVARTQDVKLVVLYLNCKLKHVADTEYRLIAQLCRLLGKAIPPTGLPTDEVYTMFYAALEKQNATVVLVLDEIDQLIVKAGDGIIYNLTRINTELKHSRVSIVGLSNDLVFADNLDPRVKSSLSEEELVFPPYNAIQIQNILGQRSEKAFKHDVLAPGVVQKCSAYAAREHGDARRALELLRVSAELAERLESPRVELAHVDEAEEKIDRDRILEIVKTQPKQFHATLYSLFLLEEKQDTQRFTGDVYDVYRDVCKNSDLRPLTQRRVSDIIAELDMLGIITARVVSKGRYGRTRELSIIVPDTIRPKLLSILREDLGYD